jgi:lysozyme
MELNLKDLVKVQLNKNQTDALESLLKDIGFVLFQNSTLLKKINQTDFDVKEEFLKWTVRNGVKEPAMLERRLSEIKLFGCE